MALTENTEADVLWAENRTQAELIADLREGQVGSVASDTGNYIQKLIGGEVKIITPQGDGARMIRDGFVDQTNVSFTITTVNDEMVGTLTTARSEDLEYYCDGVKYTHPADTVVISNFGDTEGHYWVFLVDGVLTRIDTYEEQQTAVHFGYWDADAKESIINIMQYHGTVMDEVSHAYHHLCYGSKVEQGLDVLALENFSVDGVGSTTAEYQFTRTAGTYWDEDFPQDVPVGGTWAPTFWDEGGLVRRHIPTGSGNDLMDSYLYNAPSGRPYYNGEISPGVRGLVEVDEGKFFCVIVFAVGGGLNGNVSILGKTQYDTLQEARVGIPSELKRTEGGYATLREIASVGVVLFQASDLFTNARKAKVIPFSSANEGFAQNYYDLRYPNANVLIYPEAVVEEGYDLIDDYSWARYSAFYGACANDTGDEFNDFSTATTFSIHRNSINGNSHSTELDNFPTGGKFKLESTAGATAVVTINGDLTKASNIYTGAIADADVTGTFQDADVVTVSIQSAVSAGSGKIKTTLTDTVSDFLTDKLGTDSTLTKEILTDVGTGEQSMRLSITTPYFEKNNGTATGTSTFIGSSSSDTPVSIVDTVGDPIDILMRMKSLSNRSSDTPMGSRFTGYSSVGSARYFDVAFDPNSVSWGIGIGTSGATTPISGGMDQCDVLFDNSALSLPDTTIDDINSAGLKAVPTKDYVDNKVGASYTAGTSFSLNDGETVAIDGFFSGGSAASQFDSNRTSDDPSYIHWSMTSGGFVFQGQGTSELVGKTNLSEGSTTFAITRIGSKFKAHLKLMLTSDPSFIASYNWDIDGSIGSNNFSFNDTHSTKEYTIRKV